MHITDSLIKSAYSFTVCKKAEKPISTQSATKSNEGILLIHIMQDLSIAQQSAPSAQNSNSSQYQFSRMNAPGGFPLSVPSLPARLPVLKPDGEGLPQMSVRQPL